MNPPAAVVPFVKASACGNDFLIIDGSLLPPIWPRSPSESAIATKA